MTFNAFQLTREQLWEILKFPENIRKNFILRCTYLVPPNARFDAQYITGVRAQYMTSKFSSNGEQAILSYLYLGRFLQDTNASRVDWWLDVNEGVGSTGTLQMMCRLQNNFNSGIVVPMSSVTFVDINDGTEVNRLDINILNVSGTCAINPPTSTVLTCTGSLIINPNGTISCDGSELRFGTRNLP